MSPAALSVVFAKLNLEQLREVNRLACARINELHRVKAHEALRKFAVGDLVEFTSDKLARKVRMRVDRINGKSLSGLEVGAGLPSDRIGGKWRASPHLCRLVGS
jgi:hypothetical protein